LIEDRSITYPDFAAWLEETIANVLRGFALPVSHDKDVADKQQGEKCSQDSLDISQDSQNSETSKILSYFYTLNYLTSFETFHPSPIIRYHISLLIGGI
jgi:hypothetical protein